MRGIMSAVAVIAVAGCVAVAPASGATPRQIYGDLADNGRLDHAYSAADLVAALKDAQVQGYGSPAVVLGLTEAAQKELRAQRSATRSERRPSVTPIGSVAPAGSTLPFTGFDVALLAVGGAAMLLVGGGLRRLGRAKE
jgi:hypothetical protein